MTSKRLFVRVLTGLAVALGATVTISTGPSDAQTRGFFCGRDSNSRYGEVPATIARTARGDVPIIHWVSNWSSGSGWTPQRRCNLVSQKFQRYHKNGTLKFMRTGQFNGYPVICIASYKGGSCQEQNILVTLPKEGNAADTLEQMTDLRYRSRKEPLIFRDEVVSYEDGEAYVDIDEFLNRVTVQEIQEVQETPSEDLEELW